MHLNIHFGKKKSHCELRSFSSQVTVFQIKTKQKLPTTSIMYVQGACSRYRLWKLVRTDPQRWKKQYTVKIRHLHILCLPIKCWPLCFAIWPYRDRCGFTCYNCNGSFGVDLFITKTWAAANGRAASTVQAHPPSPFRGLQNNVFLDETPDP